MSQKGWNMRIIISQCLRRYFEMSGFVWIAMVKSGDDPADVDLQNQVQLYKLLKTNKNKAPPTTKNKFSVIGKYCYYLK